MKFLGPTRLAVHPPADPVGVHVLDLVALTPDGKSYVLKA